MKSRRSTLLLLLSLLFVLPGCFGGCSCEPRGRERATARGPRIPEVWESVTNPLAVYFQERMRLDTEVFRRAGSPIAYAPTEATDADPLAIDVKEAPTTLRPGLEAAKGGDYRGAIRRFEEALKAGGVTDPWVEVALHRYLAVVSLKAGDNVRYAAYFQSFYQKMEAATRKEQDDEAREQERKLREEP